jgi:hypothetical protein
VRIGAPFPIDDKAKGTAVRDQARAEVQRMVEEARGICDRGK